MWRKNKYTIIFRWFTYYVQCAWKTRQQKIKYRFLNIWTFVYTHTYICESTEFLVTKVVAVIAAKRYRKKRARQNIITNNINWLILNWKWNLLIIFHSKCLLAKCNAFAIPLSVCASANWLIDIIYCLYVHQANILTQQRVHRGNEWKIVWTQNSDGH